MRFFFTFLCISIFPFWLCAQNSQIPYYEQIYFESERLSAQIPIQIYLPPDYLNNAEKYQVHFVFDGILSARMYAGIADHYSQLNLMPEIIVIGMSLNRRFGQVEYGKFLENELVPFIDSAYRTAPFRLLAGHSSSGEQTLYHLFRGSGRFHAFLAGSPTGLEKFISSDIHSDPSGIKFIYTAIAENDFREIGKNYPAFIDQGKVLFSGASFYSEKIPGSTHYTCFPVMINNALLILFENWSPSISEKQFDSILPMIKTHYQELSARFGYQVIMPEKTIFRMAYQWINRDKNYRQAIELLDYGILNYPQSGFLFHLLARAYHKSGRYGLAEKYYQEALERAPDYQVAIDDYEMLKKEKK